ncbi:MAG: DUF1929 domain-containing protein, partial [Actinobacteria bacterium]|nr:DUF1929 domain-containing protein [Actinomycetota bacterium]
KGYYRVGRGLDGEGEVTGGWSPWREVPEWFSWMNEGAGVAVADLSGDGGADLVVFMVDAPDGANKGYYRVGRGLDGEGEVTGGWSPWREVPEWFSWMNEGAGVAVAAFAESVHEVPEHHHHDAGEHAEHPGGGTGGQPERQVFKLVVFQVDAPEGQNQAFYRIGKNLDADGMVNGGWNAWVGVPGWFSWHNQGGGVATRPAAGGEGLVVLLVDSPEGQNAGQYQLLPIAADPASEGAWEELPYLSEVLAVHGATLPSGKILFFAGSGASKARFESPDFGDVTKGVWTSVVWDPHSAPGEGEFSHPENLRDAQGRPIDFFCCGNAFLADGSLLTAGGTIGYPNGGGFVGRAEAVAFDPWTARWTPKPAMARGRWYPTLVTLGDGSVLTVSGAVETGGVTNPDLEIYHPDTDTWQLLHVPHDIPALPLYPHLFQMADGRVFFAGGRVDDPSAVGPCIIDISHEPVTVTPVEGLLAPEWRNQAASVVLPPAQHQNVLIIGGGPAGGQANATESADIIDLREPAPRFRPAAPLSLPRMHLNAVILPDRTVLVCGGALQREEKVVGRLQAEIYDPSTDSWRIAASSTIPRLYHSIALLLPDGRVVAGGGNPQGGKQAVWKVRDENGEWKAADPNEELRLDVYHPPYLFRGERPVIEETEAEITYGQRFSIRSPAAGRIQWVSLIRPGVTTHSFDSSQRLVDLEITAQANTRLDVAVPINPNLAPPGWYMLFITDNDSVPSVASWVRLA